MPSTLALHCTPHIRCGHYTALARVDGHRPVPSVLAVDACLQLPKHTTRDEGPIQDNSQACGRRELCAASSPGGA